MEGFLDLRMRPWLRRLITRSLAIIPAVAHHLIIRRQGTYSAADSQPGDPQHAASLRRDSADPFHERCGAHGRACQSRLGESAGVATAAVIVGLNVWLVGRQYGPWMVAATWHAALLGPSAGRGRIAARLDHVRRPAAHPPLSIRDRQGERSPRIYPRPCIAGFWCRSIIPAATARPSRTPPRSARSHGATLYLLHVEEGVTSQLFGALPPPRKFTPARNISKASATRSKPRESSPSSRWCTAAVPKDEIVRLAREHASRT